MIKILLGNEPCLIDYQKRKFIHGISIPELNLKTADVFTEDIIDFLRSCPIIDSFKAAVINLDDLRDLDTPVFAGYRNAPVKDSALVVTAREYDARTSFFKSCSRDGLLEIHDKKEAINWIPSLLSKKAAKRGVSFSGNALSVFMEQENYIEREDITLYTLLNDLNSLTALGNPVTEDMVHYFMKKNQVNDVFGVASMVARRDTAALRLQAALLAGNEIAALAALLREYRIAYKAKYFSYSDIGAGQTCFNELSTSVLLESIRIITDAISSLKSGKGLRRLALETVYFKLISISGS